MTFVRAIIFTLLVPCSVAIFIPLFLLNPEIDFHFLGDRVLGLILIIVGTCGYISTALSFLIQGKGTPAIWFTRELRFLIGEEPSKAVTAGLYRFSRNPMYLSVFTFTLGLGFYRESYSILEYSAFIFILFHLVVVFIEEPHLKKKFGESYEEYLKRTKRWL